MENTGKLLFDDDTPCWYVSVGDQPLGPLSAEDVYEKILSGQLTWAHYVWKKGQSSWKRICDVKTFQVAVPDAPSDKTLKDLKKVSSSEKKSPPRFKADLEKTPGEGASDRVWFLHYKGNQVGPFALGEVKRYIKVGKIHGRVFAWKDGLEDWTSLENIKEFKDDIKKAPPSMKSSKKSESEEHRQTPRKPLIAKILLANDNTVITGVCRDISVGGMQVLTDRVPGVPGTTIRLNVSPPVSSHVEPFVAEGKIVRVLEDGRGFSFRFEKLDPNSRRAIESYIELPT